MLADQQAQSIKCFGCFLRLIYHGYDGNFVMCCNAGTTHSSSMQLGRPRRGPWCVQAAGLLPGCPTSSKWHRLHPRTQHLQARPRAYEARGIPGLVGNPSSRVPVRKWYGVNCKFIGLSYCLSRSYATLTKSTIRRVFKNMRRVGKQKTSEMHGIRSNSHCPVGGF